MVVMGSWFCILVLVYVGVSVMARQVNTDVESFIDGVLGRLGDKPSPTYRKGNSMVLPGPFGPCICVPPLRCKKIQDEEDPNETLCENSHEVCCTTDNIKETQLSCGYRFTGIPSVRLQPEEKAEFGEFPWMTAIFREEESEDSPEKHLVYHCGGTLIHPQVVLTAAHCVSDTGTKYKIRVGELDITNTKEPLPHQDADVQEIVIHSEFDNSTLYNNIALLILEKPVTLGDHVNVICLPPQGQTIKSGRCVSTGWGKNSLEKDAKYPAVLKQIDLPIIPRSECQDRLRKTRLGVVFNLHQSFICAGGELGKDTCQGDGGSPLVCRKPGLENRYIQTGIVAWGLDCPTNDPSAYVDTALFSDWIDKQLKLRKLDGSSYRL